MNIIELAKDCGATHKQSLGVYQFFTDELQAFANAVIEECAKVCEEFYSCEGIAQECAAAIRAMKSNQGETK